MNIGNNYNAYCAGNYGYGVDQGLAQVGKTLGQAAAQAAEKMPAPQWDTYAPSSGQVQTREASRNPFSSDWGSRGYSVDVNGNGVFDRGADAVIVLDYNGDGRLEDHEISATGDMMRSMRNDYDFDNDGSVSNQEARMGYFHRQRFGQLDLNRDGRLSNDELSRGGAHAWQDHNGDGRVGSYEAKSVSSISVPGGMGRIEQVDPYSGRTQVTARGWTAGEQQMMSRITRAFGQTY